MIAQMTQRSTDRMMGMGVRDDNISLYLMGD